MRMPRIRGLALSLAVISMSVFADTHEEHEHGHNEDHSSAHKGHGERRVTLSHEEREALNVEVATAGAGEIARTVTLPGEVHLNREALAHITPRFPAKLTAVNARIGDTVSSGQVLARAESSETLAHFALTASIDGRIIERHATLGEHLQPSDTAFVVADLSTLWVDIALYPKHVARVDVEQPANIHSPHGPDPVSTYIDYVAPTVDEQTRTGLARIFLDNRDGRWKPGMFVDVSITLEQFAVDLAVPHSALVELEGQTVVFVEEQDGWHPREVRTGRRDAERVEILEGLEPGERYVAEGGFVLKADLQKSEFESGHHH